MSQQPAPQETGVLDPRQLSVPLLVVVPIVAVIVSTAIWGVRTIDRTAADIAAIRAALPALWSVADQREWSYQLGRQIPDLKVPDVDAVKDKISKNPK